MEWAQEEDRRHSRELNFETKPADHFLLRGVARPQGRLTAILRRVVEIPNGALGALIDCSSFFALCVMLLPHDPSPRLEPGNSQNPPD
jgi:hypothetical protein